MQGRYLSLSGLSEVTPPNTAASINLQIGEDKGSQPLAPVLLFTAFRRLPSCLFQGSIKVMTRDCHIHNQEQRDEHMYPFLLVLSLASLLLCSSGDNA